jgi:hypothetical protein
VNSSHNAPPDRKFSCLDPRVCASSATRATGTTADRRNSRCQVGRLPRFCAHYPIFPHKIASRSGDLQMGRIYVRYYFSTVFDAEISRPGVFGVQEVAGSNPAVPTKYSLYLPTLLTRTSRSSGARPQPDATGGNFHPFQRPHLPPDLSTNCQSTVHIIHLVKRKFASTARRFTWANSAVKLCFMSNVREARRCRRSAWLHRLTTGPCAGGFGPGIGHDRPVRA